jgi:HEAT repeat protein
MSQLTHYLVELFSGEDERAEAVVAAIVALPPHQRSEMFMILEDELRSSLVDHRWWVLRALADLPDPRVPGILINGLEDADPTIRQCAALGLRVRPDPKALPALIALLEGDETLSAQLAADALVAIGTPAIPALIEVLGQSSRSARIEAARALALIGDPNAIPALFAVLDEDSALLQYWAEEGLDRMGVGMVFFNPE